MNIIYDEKLKAHMRKKNISYIIIEAYAAKSWAGVTEITARFADKGTASRAKKSSCRVLEGEIGEILIKTRGMEYEDTVTLSLESFLGLKSVKVKGIKP